MIKYFVDSSSMATNFSFAHLVSSFSGSHTENVDFFVAQLEEIASLEAWSEQKQFLFLKLHLRDAALQFLHSDPTAISATTFSELATALKKKFSSSKSFQQRERDFANIRQKPTQSVQELADQLLAAAHLLFGSESAECEDYLELKGNMIRQKFLDALRPDIRTEVLKFDPVNLDGTIKRAKQIEVALLDDTTQSGENVYAQTVCNNMSNRSNSSDSKLLSELQNKIRELESKNETLSRQINNVSSNVRCHICGKGHVTTKCWNYPANQNSNNQGYRGNRHSPYNGRRGSYSGNRRGTRGNFLR